MPSASPASVKRPSMHERSASGQSLSSSGKQQTHIHKVHRPHIVGRHSRNASHGKNLSKLGRVDSSNNVSKTRNHERKKSGASTPGHSPKSPGLPKRNSSHVTLPKNSSHGNLRKNQSATILSSRQGAQANFKRAGLPPTPKPKNENQKTGFFQLGDQSSGEEEGEWEDSTTQSPELTRNNSKASTPARVATPNAERGSARAGEPTTQESDDTSPSEDAPESNKASVPKPRDEPSEAGNVIQHDPELLQTRRASRAPPAMSTVSAIGALDRSESNKSFQQINHSEAASMNVTPNMSVGEGSASADKPVSKFLRQPSTSSEVKAMIDDASDEDSANFMNNYKPQPSESPEKPRHMHKARFSSMPSRTQQKLELERREMLRTGGGPATPPAATLTMGGPSTLSLHSRSGSRGRNRSYMDESKALKVSYETGIRQLTVVRRFRNPLVESFTRLKEAGTIPADTGVVTPGGAAQTKNRPQSRRGGTGPNTANGLAKAGVSRSLEENQPSPLASRSSSRGRSGRSQFQRQGSHDDIGVTPVRASFDGAEEDDGMSPEEALMRRLWNSREVYETTGPAA